MVKNFKKKEAKLIDGKKIADNMLARLRGKIAAMKKRPGLVAILVGDDPASKLYIKNKEKACLVVGINFHKYLCSKECFPDITESEVLEMIRFLNKDPNIHGIIVQLPLPKKFNTKKIISAIDPKKDVDGFHPKNFKAFINGKSKITPPLIQAILKIIQEYKLKISGKKVLILANSEHINAGLSYILNKLGAVTEIVGFKNGAPRTRVRGTSKYFKGANIPYHPATRDWYRDKNFTLAMKSADIIISALGRPRFIKGKMIKKDVILIDAGITLTKSHFCGDVDMESVKKIASFLTPTPGGVGPITVSMLLENTYQLAQ